MKRDIYTYLLNWKKETGRKPLILKGARQVGKTYILKEFGRREYRKTAYFDFEKDPALGEIFKGDLSPDKIVEKLSIALEEKIEKNETLIIFDEIQECPAALTSLKYFCDEAPEFNIIASGSLLGIKLGQKKSFPVGKVKLKTLHPMSFKEFLSGIGKDRLRELIRGKEDTVEINKKFHAELIDYLKIYFFIGGMPEAVYRYSEDKNDFNRIRQIQKDILTGYEDDFGKHSSKNDALKIKEIWETIPKELAKENKKFMISHINKNARYRDYWHAIQWLENSGYIYLIKRISRPSLPLVNYTEKNVFKLFFLDTGLLGAMLNLSPRVIIEGSKLFKWYNGVFTENYVTQQLIAEGIENIYYWASGATAEVDFIVEEGTNIYPLEVKSGVIRKSISLETYNNKYNPDKLCRSSISNFSSSGKYRNFPLYAVSLFPSLLEKISAVK